MSDQPLTVRMAGFQDVAAVRRMALDGSVARRSLPRGLTDAAMREIRKGELEGLEKLLRRENVRIYVASSADGRAVGFVLVMLAYENPVTGEFQAEINDLYVAPEFRRRGLATALLTQASRFVHSKGLKYLTAEVFSENAPTVALLQRCGFVEEVKSMLRVAPAPRREAYPMFPVRAATALDFPKIRALATETCVFSKPSGRDIDVDMLRELYSMRMYDPVEARAARRAFYLVAHDVDRQFAGFLLAEREEDFFSNQEQLKVVNIAVDSRFRGTEAAHALFNHLLGIARQEAIDFVTGVIAAENRRSWLFFRKMWSSLEERKLFSLRVSRGGLEDLG